MQLARARFTHVYCIFRTSATAILTHSWDDTEDEQKWKDFMKCSVERDGQFITPLRMLIEKMPGKPIHLIARCDDTLLSVS